MEAQIAAPASCAKQPQSAAGAGGAVDGGETSSVSVTVEAVSETCEARPAATAAAENVAVAAVVSPAGGTTASCTEVHPLPVQTGAGDAGDAGDPSGVAAEAAAAAEQGEEQHQPQFEESAASSAPSSPTAAAAYDDADSARHATAAEQAGATAADSTSSSSTAAAAPKGAGAVGGAEVAAAPANVGESAPVPSDPEDVADGVSKEEQAAVRKTMKRMQWESVAQCSRRRRFLKKVVEDQRKRLDGRIDLEELELFSALYYNVKFLHCTYDRRLLERLKFYEPSICATQKTRSTKSQNGDAQEIVTG